MARSASHEPPLTPGLPKSWRVASTVRQSGFQAATARQADWRAALELIALRNWALYQRHPWLLALAGGRPVLGPNASLKYEAELRPLDGIGLTDVEMDSVLTLVLTHVEGTARAQAFMMQSERDSGLTDAEWWMQTAPLLEKVIDDRRFPGASRVGEAAGQAHQAAANPIHAFRFGLDRIFDGVADLIAERQGPAHAPGVTPIRA